MLYNCVTCVTPPHIYFEKYIYAKKNKCASTKDDEYF